VARDGDGGFRSIKQGISREAFRVFLLFRLTLALLENVLVDAELETFMLSIFQYVECDFPSWSMLGFPKNVFKMFEAFSEMSTLADVRMTLASCRAGHRRLLLSRLSRRISMLPCHTLIRSYFAQETRSLRRDRIHKGGLAMSGNDRT
jgi:hypothetical protein